MLSSWKATVCNHCGFDKKNNIDTCKKYDLNELVLPIILIVVGFLLNLGASVYLGGVTTLLPLLFIMNIVLFVKIPIMICLMIGIGKLMGIDFGSLSTGVMKLMGLSLISSGLNGVALSLDPIAATGVTVLSTITYIALFIGLFQLSFYEALRCWFGFVVISIVVQLGIFVLSAQG